MTDKEIMYHRFSRNHIKKHTGFLAEMLGMSRQDYEAAVKRGMDEEARELRIKKLNVMLDKMSDRITKNQCRM